MKSYPDMVLTVQGIDHERISCEAKKNTAGLVATKIMSALKRREGLRIDLIKGDSPPQTNNPFFFRRRHSWCEHCKLNRQFRVCALDVVGSIEA